MCPYYMGMGEKVPWQLCGISQAFLGRPSVIMCHKADRSVFGSRTLLMFTIRPKTSVHLARAHFH
jgi:hypothetical protein